MVSTSYGKQMANVHSLPSAYNLVAFFFSLFPFPLMHDKVSTALQQLFAGASQD